MAVRQLLSPNLDNDPNNPLYIYQGGKILTDWYCWCLAVTAGSFGAKGGSYSAKTAWQSCNTKHCDFNLPEKVWIPVWWEGGDYGHVAEAYRDGNHITVYSSPYTHKATFDVFQGDDIKGLLNYIGQAYRVGSFSGWSETLLDSRIIEFYQDKSNEDICKEVWEGKWGTGRDRRNRLTEAGYDYDTIQRMIDQGIGKPEPESVVEPEPTSPEPVEDPEPVEPQPEPTPEPEPVSEPSSEPTEPIETEPIVEEPTNETNNEPKEEQMAQPTEPFEPAQEQADAQYIGGIIEEASSGFEIPKKVKLIAYIVGDILLIFGMLLPNIINALQAPTLSVWGEYVSKVLLEGGVYILLVFKLIKKKK